jgi:hypothetical protein
MKNSRAVKRSGHGSRMEEMRNAYKILVREPEEKRRDCLGSINVEGGYYQKAS